MINRLLSLDGGGMRGLITTAMLEELNVTADCYAGTSTGGIIALGLAKGMPPAEITAFYRDNGKDIFKPVSHGILGAKYTQDGLRELLLKHFGTMTLGDLPKRVIIPTFDLRKAIPNRPDCWAPRFMHNFPNLPDHDCYLSCVEAALRTSAAPTFFPTEGTHIDGGVVANDPTMISVSIMLRSGVMLQDIRALSLGTGIANRSIPGDNHNWGTLEFIQPLIHLLLDANASNAEYMAPAFLGANYFRLNPQMPEPIELDDWQRSDDLIAIGHHAPEISEAFKWIQGRWNQ